MASTVQLELRLPTDEIYIQVMVFLELDLEEKIEGTEKGKMVIYMYFISNLPITGKNSQINSDKIGILLKINIL